MAAKTEAPDTVVAANMRIEGELKSGGNIKIDGIISGKVQTSADLVIGPNAQIDADLIASNAVIAGTVKGNVTIKNSLTVLESGKIVGNVSCSSLGIREGAYFSGNCRMQEPKQNAPSLEPE
ncbi:MAG: polymer-forming cytoskeletal protein [Candidatus Doudnabacteria bacterium]|nr:polymer-forming cytoskeletal protein [Candidatus Doudnabacteria bacterium]